MKKVWGGVVLAFALWFVMFSPLTAQHVNFWVMMTVAAVCLTVYTTVCRREVWKDIKVTWLDIVMGIAIAAVLWGVFWVGDKLSSMMFNFARPQVNAIYGIKEGASPVVLSLLLLLVIGPAEELFWRGFVQNSLSKKYGLNPGFVVAVLAYTLVHCSSLNFMLVMSALVCGVAWGLLYRLFPERFAAIILSHALWDAAVFIWFPI